MSHYAEKITKFGQRISVKKDMAQLVVETDPLFCNAVNVKDEFLQKAFDIVDSVETAVGSNFADAGRYIGKSKPCQLLKESVSQLTEKTGEVLRKSQTGHMVLRGKDAVVGYVGDPAVQFGAANIAGNVGIGLSGIFDGDLCKATGSILGLGGSIVSMLPVEKIGKWTKDQATMTMVKACAIPYMASGAGVRVDLGDIDNLITIAQSDIKASMLFSGLCIFNGANSSLKKMFSPASEHKRLGEKTKGWFDMGWCALVGDVGETMVEQGQFDVSMAAGVASLKASHIPAKRLNNHESEKLCVDDTRDERVLNYSSMNDEHTVISAGHYLSEIAFTYNGAQNISIKEDGSQGRVPGYTNFAL